MSDKLDQKLQELATTNWEQFLEIVGENFILTAKARILRREGKSWRQISMSLKISEMQARYAVKKNGC